MNTIPKQTAITYNENFTFTHAIVEKMGKEVKVAYEKIKDRERVSLEDLRNTIFEV